MISVTKLNDNEMIINCELIESIESNPDTIITMTNGKKIITKETVEEILEKVMQFKKEIHSRFVI